MDDSRVSDTLTSDSKHEGRGTCWRLADLIDYELLLEEDVSRESAALEERDGSFREKLIGGLSENERKRREPDTTENRRWWLFQWLRFRQLQTGKNPAPGAGVTIESTLSSVSFVFTVAGAALGFLSLLGLMLAPGVIDVFVTLLVYLGPQLLLLASALFLIFRQRRVSQSSPVIHLILSKLLVPLFRILRAGAWSLVEGRAETERSLAGIGLIAGRGRVHREALGWPLLCVLQSAALAFAVSVSLGMFVACIVSHFNFGWGSSEQAVTPAFVHDIVRGIALPWAWLFGEGVGYPTLHEIGQSRIFREQQPGADFLRLTSWYRFLSLSLFTYACLPRLVLLSYSRWRRKRALATENFKDARSDRLFRRIARPRLTRRSPDGPAGEEPSSDGCGTFELTEDPVAGGARVAAGHCLILTELDLAEHDRDKLKHRIEGILHLGVFEIRQACRKRARDEWLQELAARTWEDGVPRVMLLYRASDPIVSNLKHLAEQCLMVTGADGQLLLGLLGRKSFFDEPADPAEVLVWKEYADQLKLKNPNVEIMDLTPAGNR